LPFGTGSDTEGGVIVWGIRATRNKTTQIDEAESVDPVPDVAVFAQMLRDVELQAVTDHLPGVQIESYPDPGPAGFVACLIPEGPHKPYRAELCGKNYYQRIGDKFAVISHSLLRSLFYPRSKAVFKARAKLSWDLLDMAKTGDRHVAQMACNIELINDGTATAKDIMVRVRSRLEKKAGPVSFSSQWIASPELVPVADFRITMPMHPGVETPLFYAEWTADAGPSTAEDNLIVPLCQAPCFELTVFCENHEPQVLKLDFDTGKLLKQRGEALCEAGPVG
jgi:hypothetical protein